MKLRTLLRNEPLQLYLEKKGAVVTDFLLPENIAWLRGVLSDHPVEAADSYNALITHNILNEKLQSKVEYRCVNCSPFHIYFSKHVSKAGNVESFRLQTSITDENKYASLHLIAPLSTEKTVPLEFRYLAGGQQLAITPRGKGIPGYYENSGDYLRSNFSTLQVFPGQAVIFFRNIPYTLAAAADFPMLEISVLPYEARQIIYVADQNLTEKFLQPYETELGAYLEYQSGNEHAFTGMKAFKKVSFRPVFLSDEEKQILMPKLSLQKLFLKVTGLHKLFSV